ncbi:MAG: DUF4870 domain-containing protein [Acidimicrobiia bacterium]
MADVPPPPGAGGPTGGVPGEPTSDEKTMALIAQAGPIVVGFWAPLIIFLIKKDESAFVRENAVESLNFSITWGIAAIGLWVFSFILAAVTNGIGGLVYCLICPLWIAAVVFHIIAAVAVNKGESYKYPINLRLIK